MADEGRYTTIGQLPFSLRIASTRNSDIFQELTQIRSKLNGTSKWVGGNNFNIGTICDTACCIIFTNLIDNLHSINK